MNVDASQAHPDRDRNEEGLPENARPRDRFGAPLPRDAQNELTDRVEPEDVCTTVDQAIDTAADLFGQQRFFEAHEFFEWVWKGPVTPEEDRSFFKGMAQLAVGYTHTQRGNLAGAQTLLQRGIDHIGSYDSPHYGIDVERAISGAQDFIAGLRDHAPGPDLNFPPFPRDPKAQV